MNDDNALVIARPHRPHLRPDERARALALWEQSGRSAKDVARQLGISRQSLARWKQATRVAKAVQAELGTMTAENWMEVRERLLSRLKQTAG